MTHSKPPGRFRRLGVYAVTLGVMGLSFTHIADMVEPIAGQAGKYVFAATIDGSALLMLHDALTSRNRIKRWAWSVVAIAGGISLYLNVSNAYAKLDQHHAEQARKTGHALRPGQDRPWQDHALAWTFGAGPVILAGILTHVIGLRHAERNTTVERSGQSENTAPEQRSEVCSEQSAPVFLDTVPAVPVAVPVAVPGSAPEQVEVTVPDTVPDEWLTVPEQRSEPLRNGLDLGGTPTEQAPEHSAEQSSEPTRNTAPEEPGTPARNTVPAAPEQSQEQPGTPARNTAPEQSAEQRSGADDDWTTTVEAARRIVAEHGQISQRRLAAMLREQGLGVANSKLRDLAEEVGLIRPA